VIYVKFWRAARFPDHRRRDDELISAAIVDDLHDIVAPGFPVFRGKKKARQGQSSSPMTGRRTSMRIPVYLCKTAHLMPSWLQGDLVAFRSGGAHWAR